MLLKLIFTCIILAMLMAPLALFAQDEPTIPTFFADYISEKLLGLIAAIIAATKIFRNLLGNVKGPVAVGIMMVVSVAVGELTYFQTYGWVMPAVGGVLAGAVSGGLFKLSKLFGKYVTKLNKV